MSAMMPIERRRLPWRRAARFTTGLTKRRMQAEAKAVNAFLAEAPAAFDDGTLHVLEGYLDARQALYMLNLDGQESDHNRRAAVRVARAARRAEKRQARLRELEAQLQRVEDALAPIEAELRGGAALPIVRPAFTHLDGPIHLDGHALRRPLSLVDADLPRATTTPIRRRTTKEPTQ